MSVNRWQHFLPASYIAGFGDPVLARRRRQTHVWAARRGGSVFLTKAEGVGAAKDLYTLLHPESLAWNTDPNFIDRFWTDVEGRLPQAIEALISGGELEAELWANVLVPFTAQMFVRGPDFGERLKKRPQGWFGGEGDSVFGEDGFSTSSDMENATRLVEVSRLSGLVMRCQWTVAHAGPGTRLITNDLGRTVIRDDEAKGLGFLIPLRHDAALYLTRGTEHPKLRAASIDKWIVSPIRRHALSPEDVAWINKTSRGVG